MWMNLVKTGGYIMFLNELANQANQANQIRHARARAARRTKVRSLVIGAGIGTTIGIAVGILFAPRSGKETRQIIAERTGETVKELEENAAAAKARISAVVTEKGARLREAGQKVIKTAKESLEKANEDKKKESQE
ncbi:MAG: YtxH domain-containing protein [Thermovirgaceae bacterium]|nr:YtxH domain-containing protein [Thermovirgaceae bacterium]